MNDAFEIRNVTMGVNYGMNKVRFVQPVPVDSRLRAHFKVQSWEAIGGNGAQITYEMTVEIEGQSKPACVAETILRVFA
ncbi:putative enoyl-CoA hydratase 1 [compost metagenome]